MDAKQHMKKTFAILMMVLMSINLSAFAGTTTTATNEVNKVKIEIPMNIILKQTITFNDDSTIEVYYEKKGNKCSVYSTANLNKYSAKDLDRVKSTNFERADHVEGKCYLSKTTSNLFAMARNLFGLK